MKQAAVAGAAAVSLAALGGGTARVSAARSIESDIKEAREAIATELKKARAEFDKLGTEADGMVAEIHDRIKTMLSDVESKFAEAESLPHDALKEVKRAYRSIQHGLDDIDTEIAHVMHAVEKEATNVWHDVRGWFRETGQQIDHLLDGI